MIGEARWIPAARSSDVCLLPGSAGACRAGFPRYYYNAVDERCLLFSYGGCGGNKNNFRSKAECEFACGKHLEREKTQIRKHGGGGRGEAGMRSGGCRGV